MCPASAELTWVRVLEDYTTPKRTKEQVTRSAYFRVAASLLNLSAHTGISFEETDAMLSEKDGWSEQLLLNLIQVKGDDVHMDQIASFAHAHGATPSFSMEVERDFIVKPDHEPANYRASPESESEEAMTSFLASVLSSKFQVEKIQDDTAIDEKTVCAYFRFIHSPDDLPASKGDGAIAAFKQLENLRDLHEAVSEDSVHLSHVFNHGNWSFSVGFDEDGDGTVNLITDENSFALVT